MQSLHRSAHLLLPGNFIIFSLKIQGKAGKISSQKLIMNHLSTVEETLVFQCFSWNFSNSKVNFDLGQINWHNFPLDLTTTTREICKKSEQLQWFFSPSRYRYFNFAFRPNKLQQLENQTTRYSGLRLNGNRAKMLDTWRALRIVSAGEEKKKATPQLKQQQLQASSAEEVEAFKSLKHQQRGERGRENDGEFKLKWNSTCCWMRTWGLPDRTSKDWFCSINYSASHVHKLRLDFIKSSYFDFHSRLWTRTNSTVKATHKMFLLSLLLPIRYWKCFQWKWRNRNKPRPRTHHQPSTRLTLFAVLLIPLHSPFVFTFESRRSVYTQVAIVCTHGAAFKWTSTWALRENYWIA